MPGAEAMPALFTRMSIRPRSFLIRSNEALTSAALVTSQRIDIALRPSARTSFTTDSALASWMSGMAMSAPSFAMHKTIPRPMPAPPPVTTATLPSSLIASSLPS